MSILLRLYGIAGTAAKPYLRRMLAKRVGQDKEIPSRLPERFGIASLPRPSGKLIWLHAASVGETMSVLPVIAALAGLAQVLLTTGTVTSAQLAAARLPPHARYQFVPLDVTSWITAFLDHWQPDCVVFVENEIWPAMLGLIDAKGIPRLLINASISLRSATRWRKLPSLTNQLIGGFRWIHAQSTADKQNLIMLGATNVLDWGNLKYAAPLLPADKTALAAMHNAIPGPAWLAASTHPGEEQIIIEAHNLLLQYFPNLITIIAPRHPERGAEFSCPRRSLGQSPQPGQIYIADTLGELGLFYRLVPFAFIGGSLVDIGGHNITEAARLGIPVLCGSHTRNISELVQKLKNFGAIAEVSSAPSLANAVRYWLNHPEITAEAGSAAAEAFSGLEDLPQKLAALIMEMSL